MSTRRRARRRWRRRLAISLAIGFALLALLVAFAGPLLRPRVEAALAEATGLDARIGELRLSLARFEARLLRVELASEDAVLLRVEEIRARVRAPSLLDGPPVVEELVVTGLELDARQGLPARPGGAPSEPLERAPVSIRRLELRDARLLLPEVDEPLGLRALARLEGDGLRVESLSLDAGRLGSGSAEGELRLFGVAEPEFDLELRLEAQGSALSDALRERLPVELAGPLAVSATVEGPVSALLARGLVELEGASAQGLRVQGLRAQPVVSLGAGGWSVETAWSARALRVSRPELPAPLELAAASGELAASPAEGRLVVSEARLAGGALRGRVGWGGGRASVALRLQDLALDALPLPLPDSVPPLAGRLDAELDFDTPLDAPREAVGVFRVETRPPAAPPAGRLAPAVRLDGRLAEGVVELAPGSVALAGARLQLSGRVPLEGELDVPVELRVPALAATLRELGRFVPALREPAGRLRGALRFDGRLAGALDGPRVEGALRVERLRVDGRAAGSLAARLKADRETLALDALALDGDWGRARGRARVPLAEPARARAELDLQALELGVLAALAGGGGGLEGRASGRLELQEGEAKLTLEVEEPAFAGLSFEAASLDLRASPEELRVERFELSSTEGRLRASGRVPLAEGERASLTFEAEALELRRELAGETLSLALDLRGELGGELLAGRLDGSARLRADRIEWAGRSLPGQSALLDLDGDRLAVELEEGPLSGRVTAGLQEPRELEGWVETPALELGGLLPSFPPVLDLGPARLELAGEAAAPRARLELSSFATQLSDVPVRSAGPVQLQWDGAQLLLPATPVEIAGREARVEARVVPGDPLELELGLRGALDLGELLRSSTGADHASGTVELDLRASGAPGALRLDGEALLSDAAWRARGLPAALEEGTARLRLDGDRILLESFEARLGGGRLTGSGQAEWTGAAPGRHRFELSAQGVRLRAPEGFQGLAGFELQVAGEGLEATTLSGELRLEGGRYAKDLNLERNLATSGRAPPSVRAPGPLDKVALDLRVVSASDLEVRNDLATAELAADLEVRGTAARPRLVGLVEARPGGVVRFQRVSYRLIDGLVSFSPAAGNDPQLQVLAETRVKEWLVTLEIGGRLSSPRIELSSTPELPRERLVALLLSGGLVGAPGGGPPPTAAEVAPRLAQDYLAGRLDPLEQRAREALGLDVVELDPVLVGGADARGARLTVGKALTERLYLAQSVLFGGAGDATTELRLKLTEKLSLREVHEWDGGNSVELRWGRSFGPASRAAAAAAAASREGPPASVAWKGLPPAADESALREALAPPPGVPVDERELRRASERARSWLAGRGWPLARVRCELVETRRMACTADAGPRLEVELSGVGKRRRRELAAAVEQRWTELLRDEDPAAAAREAALEVLRADGRLHAEVQVETREGEEGVRIVSLLVQPGPVVRLGEVELAGESPLPEEELRETARAVGGRGLRAPRATPGLVRDAARAVADLHRGRGYLEAEVEGRLDAPPGAERAKVELDVEPGPLLRLGELRFEGLDAAEAARRRAAFGEELASDEPVRPGALDALADRIVAELDADGHPDAAVDWVLSRAGEGVVDALVSVSPGPRVRLGELSVEGLVRTEEEFVRRTLDLDPGMLLSREELVQARRRLRATGLFSSVLLREQGERADGAERVRDLVARVRERDHLDLALGAGYDTDDGPIGSLSFTNRNLDGRARSAGLHLRLSGRDSRLEGRLNWPRLGGSKWALLETLRLRRDDEEGITTRRIGLRSEFSRSFGSRVRLELHHLVDRLDSEDVELSVFDPGRDEGRLSELGAGWVFDGRDDPLRTTRGRLSSAEVRAAGSWIGSEVEQLVVEGHQAWWRPVSSRGAVLAASLRIGAGWPLDGGERLVLAERFRVGGVGSLRGFRPGHAGPLDPVSGDPVGADAMLLLRTELSLPAGSRWSWLLFADAGRGYDSVEDLTSLDLYWSAGTGFAVDTPAGPLRLVYGFALRAPEGEPGGRFHFTFGSTF